MSCLIFYKDASSIPNINVRTPFDEQSYKSFISTL